MKGSMSSQRCGRLTGGRSVCRLGIVDGREEMGRGVNRGPLESPQCAECVPSATRRLKGWPMFVYRGFYVEGTTCFGSCPTWRLASRTDYGNWATRGDYGCHRTRASQARASREGWPSKAAGASPTMPCKDDKFESFVARLHA